MRKKLNELLIRKLWKMRARRGVSVATWHLRDRAKFIYNYIITSTKIVQKSKKVQ
jgi:hypothetical protein